MDIQKGVYNVKNSIKDSPFRSLFVNPLYISLLMTTLVLITVFYLLKDDRIVKTGFYILCINFALIFLHNKILLEEFDKRVCSNLEEKICSNLGESGNVTGGVISNINKDGGGLDYLKPF